MIVDYFELMSKDFIFDGINSRMEVFSRIIYTGEFTFCEIFDCLI